MKKPVMIYVDENCSKILYSDPPPILNCHTEEEIFQQIMKCSDRVFLQTLGKQAMEWVYKYHHWNKKPSMVDTSYLIIPNNTLSYSDCHA